MAAQPVPRPTHPLKAARDKMALTVRDVWAMSKDIAERKKAEGFPDAKYYMISPMSMHRMESGTQFPTVHKLKSMEEIYSVPMAELVDGLLAWGSRHPNTRTQSKSRLGKE